MKIQYTIGEINMIHPVWVKIILSPISVFPVQSIWLPSDILDLEKAYGYCFDGSYSFEGTTFYKNTVFNKVYRIRSPQDFFNTGEFVEIDAVKDKYLKSFTIRELPNIAEIDYGEVYDAEVVPIGAIPMEGVNEDPTIIFDFNNSGINIKLTSLQIDTYTIK